jgi:3-oxoacyl-[acyl-carrier protein] reductase
MDLGIKGRRALVAASSQGLGKAVALELAKEGADVAICGRNEQNLAAAEEELSAVGEGRVVAVAGDLSSRADLKRITGSAMQQLGGIDILVTNSGGPPVGRFEQHDDAAWDQAYRDLLASAVGLIRAVLPAMKTQQWGRIVCITSQAVKQPVDNLILSNAVRSSVVGLVKTLANELGPYKITVNNVMPGFTRTRRLEKLIESNPDFASFKKDIPLGRLAEPEEFAAAVAFLCSERAAYITGTSLAVDGGWIKSLL